MSEYSDSIESSENELRIKDFVNIYVLNWKWFVVSVGIALCLALLYIARQEPSYTRSMSIMIREDSKNRSFTSELSSFGDLGLFNSTSDVCNELIAIHSPAILLETVKRLNLNVNYYRSNGLHPTTLYGRDLPAIVSFLDMSDNEGCSLIAEFSTDGKDVRLYDFQSSSVGRKNMDDYEVKGLVGDTLATPLGRIVFTATPYISVADLSEPIHISRGSYVDAIETCKGRLNIALNSEKSDIIDIDYTDVSIQRAEDVLNTLISVYNEAWIKDKNQIAVSTSQFINDRLNVIERELGNVDSDISSYKSEHLLPDVAMVSSMYMDKANTAGNQIMELNNQLYMAKYIRDMVGTDNNGQLLPANSGVGSGAIEHQIDDYNTKVLERNTLLANSSENNPLVVDLNTALTEMRRAIASSIDNQISSLQVQLSSYRESERKSNAQISSNPTQAKYLLSVERQQKVKESLYLFLLQKREENELSMAFTAYNTRIITPPMGNDQPTAPVKINIILVAFAAGVFFPAFILFLIEILNTRVRGRKDLDSLSVPFVGEIPMYGKSARKQSFFEKVFSIYRPQTDSSEQRMIVVSPQKRDSINEAFRVIRTNLEFIIGNDDKKKVIMLTSLNPGSGKTFVTLNLAATFAIKGKRTVIIDLDLRKGAMSLSVKSPKVGVTNYLNGQVEDWHKIVCNVDGIQDMSIIPMGTMPPNPSELLYNQKLKDLIAILRTEYDYIFLDCPPVEMVADANIIASLADYTVFIVRANLLLREMLPVIQRYYDEHKFAGMSVLLNGTQMLAGRYGHYGSYGYGYGYGYGESK